MQHQLENIIAQRYCILDVLGEGGSGITYLAQDLKSNERVALKALSLRHLNDWKTLELFEREACVLAQLNHPAIPRYLNYLHVDTGDCSFYIAQQLAPRQSLAALVQSSWRTSKGEVRHIATQILEILVYLHDLTPPIIHRDIKPQNIIRRKNGQVFLVDFGAVQNAYHTTLARSHTVVGTFGYMAPEQFLGQAVPATDLYGLGATLLFLLTHRSPADLPTHQLKIDFRSRVRVSKEFADWLERMLEPEIENRFHSARDALAVLQGEQVLASNSAQICRQSKQSRITVIHTQQRLVIEILPVWLPRNRRRLLGFLTLVCKLLLPPLLLTIVAMSLLAVLVAPVQPFGYNLPWWFFAFSKSFAEFGMVFLSVFPLVGLWSLSYFLFRATSRTWLEMDSTNFRLQRWLLGMCYQDVRERTQDLHQVKLSSVSFLNKRILTSCLLRSKSHKHRFGLFLTRAEKEWLVGELKSFWED